MRKKNTILAIAIAVAMLMSVAFYQTETASAQGLQPVGVVVEYIPNQSITIVDQQGNQSQFLLSPSLKILPADRADQLAVGSFVTIIAPAKGGSGKSTAEGIVVHPHVPEGWNIPTMSATPLPTGTAGGDLTATMTVTGTLAIETMTETPTMTGTIPVTDTVTPTPDGTLTETPTATPTPSVTGTINVNPFIEWLRSLFRQVLGR